MQDSADSRLETPARWTVASAAWRRLRRSRRERSLERPAQHSAARDEIACIADLQHRALGQLSGRHRQRMQPLSAAVQPFPMQHRVDVPRANVFTPLPASHAARNRLASSRRQKKQGRWPAASAVASSRKEQFGPAARRPSPCAAIPELADAGDPGRARPALLQQRLGRGIMDDAAIAGEQAAVRVATMSPVGVTRFCRGI